MKMTGTILTTA
jgi:hypothetical protein